MNIGFYSSQLIENPVTRLLWIDMVGSPSISLSLCCCTAEEALHADLLRCHGQWMDTLLAKILETISSLYGVIFTLD